jgi:hypothetical protein
MIHVLANEGCRLEPLPSTEEIVVYFTDVFLFRVCPL